MAGQQILVELPEQPERPAAERQPGPPKLIPVNRNQQTWVALDVEQLIAADHKMRAIWELTGRLALDQFAVSIASQQGEPGRPAWSPRVLVSVWLYAYGEGITSAREIAREMEHEPALQWVTGLQVINHHTLSDFRVEHGEALNDLFVQLLVALDEVGWVSLERVMHDGTKVRAQASGKSFGRQKTVEEKLAQARALVTEDPQGEAGPGNRRREAARQRVQRELEQRTSQALEELQKLQASKKDAAERAAVRVSVQEPEARMMKHGDGGIAPSYNVQVSTDAAAGVIVGVELSQRSDDAQGLAPAMDKVKENLGRYPQEAVADGGFTNREAIQEMEKREIAFYGSLRSREDCAAAAAKASGIEAQFTGGFFLLEEEGGRLRCPAGKPLEYVRINQKRGNEYAVYQAQGSDCQACVHQKQCCPRAAWKGRTVTRLVKECAVTAAFRSRMESEKAREIYRQRSAVAEFPFAQLKERFRLRKFRLRGKAKAGLEALWACLSYNVILWIRAQRKAAAAAVC